jgi:hypothetical protein
MQSMRMLGAAPARRVLAGTAWLYVQWRALIVERVAFIATAARRLELAMD